MSIAEKLLTVAENEQKVNEAGKKAEYDAFWDTYQQNGNRRSYQFAFAGAGWTNKTFIPKYNIVPAGGGGTSMFRFNGFKGNLKKHLLEELGVNLYFSKLTVSSYLFAESAGITELPDLDLTGVTGAITSLIESCTALETVKITLPATVTALTNSFNGCSALTNLTIEGVIPCAINVSACPLTHASLMSIINALQEGKNATATLGETNRGKLTADEEAIATGKGWKLA